jgi:hypothetical protein
MNSTMELATGRQGDLECQSTAGEYLTTLIGAAPENLRWDDVHHLQGRARCSGREMVVIAGRDDSHHALVFTLEDWQSIRVAAGPDRSEMLRSCAIDSHLRFLEALALPSV